MKASEVLRRYKAGERDFRGVDLRGVSLTNVFLRDAFLDRADLRDANLTKVNFVNASLGHINLKRANLSNAYLRDTFLSNADLSDSFLRKIDLRGAFLQKTDLRRANLCQSKLLNASLKQATLTGACIEDWHINSQTNLNGVVCDYVYLKFDKWAKDPQQQFRERRPHDPDKNFAPGEFAKLFQQALETVDLLFDNSIDWQAFLSSFRKLQIECNSDELTIQSFENKGDGTFVIRVNVPSSADKAEIEKFLKHQYQLEAQLEAKSQELANLMEITKLLASRPIQISNQNNQTQGDKTMTDNREINNYGRYSERDYYEQNNVGIGHISGSEIKDSKIAGTLNEGQQQNLAQAAADIQQLLQQLEQSNPTTTTLERMQLATQAIQQIESDPTFKQKAISAAKAGAIEALKQNPIGAIVVAAIEGWEKTEAS